MDNLVRLNKFIASNGVSSRRKIDELILQGRVTVNKNVIVELGHKINPVIDKVAVDGENIRTSTKKIYIVLNKPQGVVTTVSDDKHRTTVIDLINLKEKIFPVGRLDYNTTGLLLLTNDGELANKLMHPKSEIYKTYFVKLSKPLEEKHRLKLTGGIKLEDKLTAPCKIRYPKKNNNYQDLYISIYEGRNRQVRNMFEHYGYFVRELERTEYAGLKLGDMREGEWRKLTPEEITKLNELVKDSPTGNTKRVHYAKREERKDFKKYKVRDDKRDDKRDAKGFSKFEKRDDKREGAKSFGKFEKRDTKKNSKWGFKDKIKTERYDKLGFKKAGPKDDGDVKTGFKKFDKRSDKKDFKKFDKRSDKKDFKKDFKKFDKRDDRKDVKAGFKKFDKRDDKKDFNKFDDKRVTKDSKKSDNRLDKKDFKKDFKKFDKRDDRKDVKKDFKKFEKKNPKRNFKKK